MAEQPLFVDNAPFLGRVEEQKQFIAALQDILKQPQPIHRQADDNCGHSGVSDDDRCAIRVAEFLETMCDGKFWLPTKYRRKHVALGGQFALE